MFDHEEYALLDFGEGRKLERFGRYLLDRPSPAAADAPLGDRTLWPQAHARYVRQTADRGRWSPSDVLPDHWTVRHRHFALQLKPTPFGHLGVFPEQAENWEWIGHQIAQAARPLKMLNLFGYTGASSLAAAAAGAGEVVHIDSAANVVDWAKRNAVSSGLADAPIRWITEDARKFVARELRRGNRYDAVILDPPSFGHGPKGQAWHVEQHLPDLVEQVCRLMTEEPAFLLLTCHSPQFPADRLKALLADQVSGRTTVVRLTLNSTDGRKLDSGLAVRHVGCLS